MLNRLHLASSSIVCTTGLMLVLAVAMAQQARARAQSVWVRTSATGRLIYVPDADGDRIPDFSMVGYGAGQQPIPDGVPVVLHIDPIAGDNTQHIQDAIDYASSLPMQADGFRGAVELGPGKFDVDGHLSITTSGVVLRGSGAGDDLATNTHIVSQNRADSLASSPYTSVIDVHGSTSGRAYGSEIQITDKRVPVGAQSLHVASTAGMAVGGMIEIFRPSTAEWIHELGMDAMPSGYEWHAGDRDLRWQRTITRIEGNTVFFDAPITTALDEQWGGGTVRTYSLPNQIHNVGVENLLAQSLDNREESNELRTPTFVGFSRVEGGFVQDVETRYFPYASVYTSKTDGTQHVTVDNVNSQLPSGQITGGRRYTFAMDGQMSLVKNSTAVDGRHDFVTGSNVTGPTVFYNSTTSSTHADSGPHHRWGNGLLFDNITIGGNAINVQNRWTSGSGHGWAGANIVVWNSTANSFIMQAPPTAKGWLVGSTGTINAGNCHLDGASCAGYYDSPGTPVTAGGSDSLYEAQVNDAADLREFHWTGGSGNWADALGWNQAVAPGVYAVSMRQYLVGDIDHFQQDGPGSVDNAYVDPAFANAIVQQNNLPLTGFDDLGGDEHVAFTIQNQLDAGERVIHGFLAMSLQQSAAGLANDDFLQFFDTQPGHQLTFSQLGWASQVNSDTPFVGVVDMAAYLDQLQTGSVNVQVSDETGVDWAMYTVAVATPVSDPIGAMVFLDGGSVLVDAHVTPVGGLQNGGPGEPSTLTITSNGRVEVSQDFAQEEGSSLVVQIGGPGTGQFGTLAIGDQALLAGNLSLELEGEYHSAVGTQFEVVTAGGGFLGTTFDDPIVADLSGEGVWGINYSVDAVIAELISDTKFGDLSGDGTITAADWTMFKSGQGADFTGLTLAQVYALGDVNGDYVHDLDDFLEFRQAYEFANGAGSFARMVGGVPEPGTLALANILCAFAATLRRRPCRAARGSASPDSGYVIR